MHRSVNQKKKEIFATSLLWVLTLTCGSYISWKIDPLPIQHGIGWVSEQTGQFFDRCIGSAFTQTLPALSWFFEQKSMENKSGISDFPKDPSYTRYLGFHQPGDG